MNKKFNQIDISTVLPEIYPVKVKFPNDKRDYVYDFSLFGDTEIHRVFAKVFYERNSVLTQHTRGKNFGSLNKFFMYLNELQITKLNEITSLVIANFAVWLDIKKISLNTKYHYYNATSNSLSDIKALNNSVLKELRIPITPFKNANSERVIPPKMSSIQLKQVLSICYLKIEQQMNDFRKSQIKNIEVKNFLDNGGQFNWKDKDHIIYHFFNKYGYVPFSSQIDNHEKEMFRNIGGVNILLSTITPDIHMLLPFYIILLFELAANSDALRQIKVNCIIEDPLFEDRCFITWHKGRATEQQKRNIFKNKKWGAFHVIEMVKEFTQHTRKFINKEYLDFLFICRGEMAKTPFLVPHDKGFKWAVDLFCKNNKLDFSFNHSDIRPSVLTELYRKRKDVVAVSKLANHKSIDTTLLYIVDDEIKKENREYLSKKQSNILQDILNSKENNTTELQSLKDGANIGFTCSNPIIDKKVCINWMAELTNPELIIPANSIYLSRIISIKNSILHSKNLMNKERFSLLYEPILTLINEQILIKFSPSLIKEAMILAKNIKILNLEEY